MVSTYLGNYPTRIRFSKSLSQSRAVDLKPSILFPRKSQISQNALPDAFPLPNIPGWILAHQPHEIKVSYNARAQLLKHVVLKIVVILIERFFGLATACVAGCGKHLLVVVNGSVMDIMH